MKEEHTLMLIRTYFGSFQNILELFTKQCLVTLVCLEVILGLFSTALHIIV